MDKILSARVDEGVIREIGELARELHTTKKAVIEAAIRSYARNSGRGRGPDVFELTCGAWQRDERPEKTVESARREFRDAIGRHHR